MKIGLLAFLVFMLGVLWGLCQRPTPSPTWRQEMAQELFGGRAVLLPGIWITNTAPGRVQVTFEFAKP